jgi:hypothetical protein
MVLPSGALRVLTYINSFPAPTSKTSTETIGGAVGWAKDGVTNKTTRNGSDLNMAQLRDSDVLQPSILEHITLLSERVRYVSYRVCVRALGPGRRKEVTSLFSSLNILVSLYQVTPILIIPFLFEGLYRVK